LTGAHALYANTRAGSRQRRRGDAAAAKLTHSKT
jgi:hypothetical protein